jgi:endonuclease/exonuclease/phosphatase family metal-dependent hydrolase
MRILKLLTLLFSISISASALELRVLTYNIHHAKGTDGVLDIDRIVEVIKSSEADIVCLQEVDQNLSRTERMDMPELFRKKLSMHVVFGANYHFDDGHYGNLTLSKFPIASSENIPLPNPFNKEPRGGLKTTIKISLDDGSNAHTNVEVYNTHLGLNGKERHQQVMHILSKMKLDTPTILLGDLNEITNAAGVQSLLEKFADSDEGKVPINTIPSENATKRIDYILHHKFKTTSLAVVESSHITVASDHLPLVAVLNFKH